MIVGSADSRRVTGYILHSSLFFCRRRSESFHSADSAFESSFYDGGHISLLDNRCRRAYYDSRVRGGIGSVSIIKKDIPAEYRVLIQKLRLIDDTFFKESLIK